MKLTGSDEIGDVILAELYHRFINDHIAYDESVAVNDLIEKSRGVLAPDDFGTNAARIAIDDLEDANFVKYDEDQLSPSIRITTMGVRKARILVSDEYKLAGRYFLKRQEFDNVPIPNASSATAVEGTTSAVDDWVPLKIDRTSSAYREAVESLQEAYDTIRSDNGFAASEPEERNAIVDSLESGLDQLKNKTPTTSSIRALIIKPLAFVTERFAGAILGEAAKTAWRKIADWLASSFGGTWF